MNIVNEVKKAVKYTSQGKYKKAEQLYKSLLKAEPENPVVLSCLGLLYLNTLKLNSAKKILLKAYSIKPLLPTIEGLGLVYYYLQKPQKAIEYFDKIMDKTTNSEVFEKAIDILLERKKHTKALELATRYKKLYPLKKEAQELYGYCLMNKGRFEEAFPLFTNLIAAYPKYNKAWHMLGLIYEVYFHDENLAKTCYEKVAKLGDKYAGYANLIINASKRFDFDDAFYYIKKFDRYYYSKNSGVKKQDYLDIDFTKAVVYFKHRDFFKAYKYYTRHSAEYYKLKPIDKLKNFWDGKTYKDETLLVYMDQGIGDGIMFSRYLPTLRKKFKQIKVLSRAPISTILQRSFKQYKDIKIYTYKEHMPKYDKSVIASSLPYVLKMGIDKIPLSNGYLIADDNKVNEYKKYFNNDKYKVGICWEAGGAGWRELLNRTLNVSLYEPFFEVPNTQFYSLQVSPSMDNYKDYPNIIDLAPTFKDFDDTAAAIKNLDLLITVDTSVAHLAGALGIKTFMLLPYCPDWRWFDNDKTTEWYDSVTIFRQTNTKNWDSVVDGITSALTEAVKKYKSK